MNLTMYCAKTLCNLFDCVFILPDFKSFVKALNFYEIQGGFYNNFFWCFLVLNILFNSKHYFKIFKNSAAEVFSYKYKLSAKFTSSFLNRLLLFGKELFYEEKQKEQNCVSRQY